MFLIQSIKSFYFKLADLIGYYYEFNLDKIIVSIIDHINNVARIIKDNLK